MTVTDSRVSPPPAIASGTRNEKSASSGLLHVGLSVGATKDLPATWFEETGVLSPPAQNASPSRGLQGALASAAAFSLMVIGAVAMCTFSRRRRRTLEDPERSIQSPSQLQQLPRHPLARYQPTATQRASHRTTLALSSNSSQLAAASVPRPLATTHIAKRQSVDPIYISVDKPSPVAVSLEAQRATLSPVLCKPLSARLTLVTADHAVSAATFKGTGGDAKKTAFTDQSPDATESAEITESSCDNHNDGDQEMNADDPCACMPASPSTIQSFCSPYIALDLDRSPLVPLATSLALDSQVDLSMDISQISFERYEHEGVAEAAEGQLHPVQALPYVAVGMMDLTRDDAGEKRLTAIHAQAQQQPLDLSSASSTSFISRSNTSSSAMTITPLTVGVDIYAKHAYERAGSAPNPYPSPVSTDPLRPAALQLAPVDDAANSSSSTSTLVCKSPVPTLGSASVTTMTANPDQQALNKNIEPRSSSSSMTTLSITSLPPKSPHRSLQQNSSRPIGMGLHRSNRPRPLATPSALTTPNHTAYSPNLAPPTLPPGLILTPFPIPSLMHASPPLLSARQMYLTTAWSHLFTRLHTDCTLFVRKSLSLATTLGDGSAPLPPLTSPAAKKRRARLVCAAASELVGRATAVVQALAAGFSGHSARASSIESAGLVALAGAMASINLGVLAPPPPPPPNASAVAAGVTKVQRDAVAEQVKARLAEDQVLFHGILAHPVLRPVASALVDKNRLAVVSAPLVAWMAVALVQVQAAVPGAALVGVRDGERVTPAPTLAGVEEVRSPYCVRRASGPDAVPNCSSLVQGQAGAVVRNCKSVDSLVRVMYHQGGSLAVDGSATSLVASSESAKMRHVKYIGTLFPGIMDERSGQVLARCRVVTDVSRDGSEGLS